MKSLRELGSGLFFATLLALVVLGALTLSLVEGMSGPTVPTSPSETPFLLPTNPPARTGSVPATGTPSATATTACPRPAGWVDHVVQVSDSLDDLAHASAITTAELRDANCLLSVDLVAGTILFLPQNRQTPTVTPSLFPTSLKCGPPAGWIQYRIRSQDTLFRLSLNYGVSVPELQFANCMGGSTFLRVGDLIYVPNVATRTPESTTAPTGTKAPTQTSITETTTATMTPTETPTPDSTTSTPGYPAP